MSRAVLLVTLSRRYHELAENLPATLAVFERDLGYRPVVVLVWARPEVGRLWFINGLVRDGLVQHVLSREAVSGEDGKSATTVPESINIRLGLEFIGKRYPGHFAVMMAADVRLQDGAAGFFASKINEGHSLVVLHWQNSCTHADVWHTNCFACILQPEYWPPVSDPKEQDVLERQWGKLLCETRPEGVFKWHNSRERLFLHRHESENRPTFESIAQLSHHHLPCSITGHLSWYRRVWSWLGVLFDKGVSHGFHRDFV